MPAKVQITLTDNEGKRLIAKAAAKAPQVLDCLAHHRVLLIGGTSVSALSEELGFGPMRISGRIDASGTRSALTITEGPHNLLIEDGTAINADEDIINIASSLSCSDLIILGANAMDVEGRAAIAFAALAGDTRGIALHSAFMQGVNMLILCGMNKLIPSVGAALSTSGRTGIDCSMGAAIGLYNVYGPIISELSAFKILFSAEATVIAGSGFGSGAGTRTYVIRGDVAAVRSAWDLCRSIKGDGISGTPESLVMCVGGCKGCQRHMGCIYKKETEKSGIEA